jgi:capsular exopolysaccharide synthesis family protein
MENGQQNEGSLVPAQQGSQTPGCYYDQPMMPAYSAAPDQPDEVHLLDYWRVIVKRRWTILSCLFAILLLTAIATWKAVPAYRATVRIRIDPEETQTNFLPFPDAQERPDIYIDSQEYLQSEFKVLESQTLALRVVRALHLDRRTEPAGETAPLARNNILTALRRALGFGEGGSTGAEQASAEERRLDNLASQVRGGLTITPVRNSRIVDVTFDAGDPKLAAAVANTLANEYIQMNFETKFGATTMASEFLAKQIEDLKARVEKSEEDLVRFSRDHDIYAIGDKENVVLQKLADLNSALTASQADRIQKEAIWKIVQQAGPGNFPDILRSDLIKTLESSVADLSVQKAKLEAEFKLPWPDLERVNSQLAEAQRQLDIQKQRVIQNAEIEYHAALQRENLLAQALAAQKLKADTFNQNSIQYSILQRQVDTDKQLYDGLLQRMKEAGVSAGLKSSNIRILDPALPPGAPYSPNKSYNLSLALVIGSMFGVGLAFFVEYLDRSVKTPDDVDRFVKLPFLGLIPSVASFSMSPHRKQLAAPRGSNGSDRDGDFKKIELIAYYYAKSRISEAYHNLRTSISLSSGTGRPPKVLLVTSSQPVEGKTTTALNLAITLAQAGGKVVLLDCDMRNPRIHRALGLDNSNGMSSFLSGNSDFSPLIQETEIPNLFAVPSGPVPPNPAVLVGSPRLKQSLVLLEQCFDHIILDSPPVLSVADPRTLATAVDGVILVIKGGDTPKAAVQRTKRLLQEVHAHITGALLNNVDIHSADYYYRSKYYCYGYHSEYAANGSETAA